MTTYYKSSLSNRIKRLEQAVIVPKSPILFIDMNEDGTYGKDSFNEKELDQYVKEKGYDVVIIDDII